MTTICLLTQASHSQTATNPSPGQEDLIRRIQSGTDAQALLQAGNSGNRQFIPFLRQRVRHDVDKKNSLKPQARMALAKLGDTQQQQAIFCRVAAGNEDEVQDALVHDLPYIGGWFSVRILDQVIRGKIAEHPRPISLPADLSIAPAQDYARQSVHKMFPDIPVDAGAIPSVQQWEAYFSTRESELRKLQPNGEGVDFAVGSCKGSRRRRVPGP